jgi:hypothetical protein
MKSKYQLCNYVYSEDRNKLIPELFNIVSISNDKSVSLQSVITGKIYTDKIPMGIPITENWLENLGFIKVELVWKKSLDITAIAFIKIKMLVLGNFHPQICNTEDDVDLDSIVYIHQLQNLYFGLTHKELRLPDLT